MKEFWECEMVCRNAYPECCIIRCGFLNQWFRFWASSIQKTGQFCWPCGNESFNECAPIDIQDFCHCCAELLLSNPGGCGGVHQKHKGQTYQLTGPECYTGAQLVNCFAKWCNTPCELKPNCTTKECKEMLEKCGEVKGMGVCGKWQQECMVEFCEWVKMGEAVDKTEDVGKLCGDSSEGMGLEWCIKEFKNEFCGC